MSRRRRNPPPPVRTHNSLIMLAPGEGIVERTTQAVADARQIAEAKRTVERGLRAAGLSVRLACATVARMTHDDLLAEAERVRAASDPVQAPEPSARPWWRRIVGRWRQ